MAGCRQISPNYVAHYIRTAGPRLVAKKQMSRPREDPDDPIETSPPPTKRVKFESLCPPICDWQNHRGSFEGHSWIHKRTLSGSFRGLIIDCVTAVKDKLISRPPVVVYGKECQQNRDVGFFSDNVGGYNYSRGNEMKAQPLPFALRLLLASVNELKKVKYKELSVPFNAVLVNRYNDGNDYIAAHSDSGLYNKKCGVWSLSVGGERTMVVRNKKTRAVVAKVPLTDGLLCEMGGEDFQEFHTHEVPREAKRNEPRISFTFRTHQ